MAILSLAEYKVFAGITNANADTRLTAILNSAEQFFLMRIRRNIEETEYTEKYNGDGTQTLVLKRWPVTDFSELKVSDEVIDSADYTVDSVNGVVKINAGTFTCGFQNVEVTYKSGYLVADIPLEIKMAIAEIVQKKYVQFDKKGETYSSEAFFGGSLVFKDSDLTDYTNQVINTYKRKGPRR